MVLASKPSNDPLHDKLLAIVLTLPEAYEDRPWGSVHCKVAGRIFVGWGRHEGGEMSLGIRVDKDLQAMLVASDPRFSIAKYVGQYGGVDMRIGEHPDWAEVEQFIVGSYKLIAPKKLVKLLDQPAGASPDARAKKPGANKPAANKPAANKPAAKNPAANKPAANKPAAKNPAAKKPAAKKATATRR